MNMRLRIRDKDKVHIITILNEKSKMIELRREIKRINGVSLGYQECKQEEKEKKNLLNLCFIIAYI